MHIQNSANTNHFRNCFLYSASFSDWTNKKTNLKPSITDCFSLFVDLVSYDLEMLNLIHLWLQASSANIMIRGSSCLYCIFFVLGLMSLSTHFRSYQDSACLYLTRELQLPIWNLWFDSAGYRTRASLRHLANVLLLWTMYDSEPCDSITIMNTLLRLTFTILLWH